MTTPNDVTSDDLRAIYSAASAYLRALYADQPSPHATKDNAVRLARIAEALHHQVGVDQRTRDELGLI